MIESRPYTNRTRVEVRRLRNVAIGEEGACETGQNATKLAQIRPQTCVTIGTNITFRGHFPVLVNLRVLVSVGRKAIEITKASIGGVQVFSAGSSGLELYAGSIWDEVKNKWRRLGLGTDRP